MKFGKNLKRMASEDHLSHCMGYSALKKAITVVVAAAEDSATAVDDLREVREAFGAYAFADPGSLVLRPPESRFHELLQYELAKVNRFFTLELQTQLEKIKEAQRSLLTPKGGELSDDVLSTAELQLDSAAEELVSIENFRRLNFTGFRKIVKKFDKQMSKAGLQGAISPWFIPQLLREHFVAVPLDSHVLTLAWGYAELRHCRGGARLTQAFSPKIGAISTPGEASPTPGEASGRSTTVFWLMPSARLRALCTLVKRFEIAVPAAGTIPGAHADLSSEQRRRRLASMPPEGGRANISARTCLVYHDAPGYPEYVQRLHPAEGAGAYGFRCRRTVVEGQFSEGSAPALTGGELVERDCTVTALSAHPFTPVKVLRAPDAFPAGSSIVTAAADALAVAEGKGGGSSWASKFDGDELGKLGGFARSVAASCAQAPLDPVASINSTRLLLRGSTNATQGVVVALDENIQFSRGHGGAANPSDAIDFPYCLLEVAHEDAEGSDLAPGSWLEELQMLAAVRRVDGFSIGAHAVAALHKEEVPELPSWYEHLTAVESTAPTEAWGLLLEQNASLKDASKDGSTKQQSAPEENQAGGALPPPPAPRPAAERFPAAVEDEIPFFEPKPLLSSERTMLEWMHTTVALAAMGAGLLQASKAPAPGSGAEPEEETSISDFQRQALVVFAAAIIGIALFFTWHAAFRHSTRLTAIKDGKKLDRIFNARSGPTLFGVAIGAALVGHLVIQLYALFRQQDALSDSSADGNVDGVGNINSSFVESLVAKNFSAPLINGRDL